MKTTNHKTEGAAPVGSSAVLGGCSVFMLCIAIAEGWDAHRTVAIVLCCTALPVGLTSLIMVDTDHTVWPDRQVLQNSTSNSGGTN